MTVLLARWLAGAVVVIGLGVAGLQLSVCVADERAAAAAAAEAGLPTDVMEPELPTEAEVDDGEVSASPRLTY
jgi:hypothetical protein